MRMGVQIECECAIEETVLLYQGERRRPRAGRMLTEQDATQSRLYNLLSLDSYAPKR